MPPAAPAGPSPDAVPPPVPPSRRTGGEPETKAFEAVRPTAVAEGTTASVLDTLSAAAGSDGGAGGAFETTCPWSVQATEDGAKYFYNSDTDESSWTLPGGFAEVNLRSLSVRVECAGGVHLLGIDVVAVAVAIVVVIVQSEDGSITRTSSVEGVQDSAGVDAPTSTGASPALDGSQEQLGAVQAPAVVPPYVWCAGRLPLFFCARGVRFVAATLSTGCVCVCAPARVCACACPCVHPSASALLGCVC